MVKVFNKYYFDLFIWFDFLCKLENRSRIRRGFVVLRTSVVGCFLECFSVRFFGFCYLKIS